MALTNGPHEEFKPLEYGDRYFVHTAKNSIVGAVQIAGEVISNSDEAITRRASREGEKDRGTIDIFYDPETMFLSIVDDGDGMTADLMESRLRHVGTEARSDSRRAFFHRGIREVFLAMGGGELASIGKLPDGRMVVSRAVFHPASGMALTLADMPPTAKIRAELGIRRGTGTRVCIPMARFAEPKPKEYAFSSLEASVRDCVQARVPLLDPNRIIRLHYGGEPPRRIQFSYPTDGQELIPSSVVMRAGGHDATLWVNLAPKPIGGGRSRQTRHHGILIRGDRAGYEVSLGDRLRAHPAMQRVYGELRVDGIEQVQREADQGGEDEQLVYLPDRSGLNSEHPLVEEIHNLIDAKLAPLVAELDATGETKKVTPDIRRQMQKMVRLINHAVQSHNPDVGQGAAKGHVIRKDESANGDTDEPATGEAEPEPDAARDTGPEPESKARSVEGGIAFPRQRLFVTPDASRTVRALVDTSTAPEGSAVEIVDPSQLVRAFDAEVPAADEDGITELALTLQTPPEEGRHEITVRTCGLEAHLAVLVRFPRTSGFISKIVPSEADWPYGSAAYDPATGVVTVFVGREEFKDARAKARRQKVDPWKFPLYRQLVAESVREAALGKAAERAAEIAWDDLPADERAEPTRFHELVVAEFQKLDHQLRGRLLESFLPK